MKTTRRIVAIVLVLSILFVLTACSKKDKLIGTWKMSAGMSLTFNEDGTYRFDPDEASFNETVASFKKTMRKVMLDYIRDIWPDYAAYGDEELTGIFEDAVGSSMEEYMDDAFKDLSFEEFKKDRDDERRKIFNYPLWLGILYLTVASAIGAAIFFSM